MRARGESLGPRSSGAPRVPGPPGACPVDPSSSHAGLAAHLAVGALGPGLGAEQPRPGGQPRPRGPALPAFPVRCRPLVAICGVASVLAPLGPPLVGGVRAEDGPPCPREGLAGAWVSGEPCPAVYGEMSGLLRGARPRALG